MPELNFDERIAKRFEDLWPDLFEPAVVDPAVDFLAELAGTGDALELGIGTGRIALPLSRRGVRVHGIELSPAMVAELQAKPGADDIDVTIGDFATAKVDGTFTLAYLVCNTIMNLTTQGEQVECFRNVASHLEPGGCFVIEVIVPGLQRLPPGETIQAFTVTPTHLGFDEYVDLATQSSLFSPLLGDRRPTRDLLGALSLRVAIRAGPHGATRRHDAARALERLEPRALHEPQPESRLGVGEGRVS